MKKKLLCSLIAIIVFCIGVLVFQKACTPGRITDENEASHQMFDINLDEKSAIQIAEIVLQKVYSDRINVLEERPWNVTKRGDIYEIEGTLHPSDAMGGVAIIKIRKKDGAVVLITHGK
jgi:hypothetical protein